MKARITITLDPECHQLAKRTARARKTTVSGLIASLLQSAKAPASASVVDQMIGSAALRSSPPGADPRFDDLKARYLDR